MKNKTKNMDYEKILKGIVQIINTTEKSDVGFANICTYIGENCPELQESEDEDEKVRKALIELVKFTKGTCLEILDRPFNAVPMSLMLAWLEKQGKINGETTFQVWKDMRLEVYAQASGNRHESNCSDDCTKMFSLCDIDEIILNITEKQGKNSPILSNSCKTGKDEKDERIRKALIEHIKSNCETGFLLFQKCSPDDVIAWLEKQDVNANKVEPKFKQRDWIIFNGLTLCINEVVKGYYRTISIDGTPCSYDWDIDNIARLWTIKDAKDGDVLARNYGMKSICIFARFNGISDKYQSFLCYCGLEDEGLEQELSINGYNDMPYGYVPATKEQRDTLERAIINAGYRWDKEKLKLEKI